MAKHCEVCNQDYAEELTACPHCAAAKKTQLASRAEDRTTQLAGPSEERKTQLADLNAAPGETAPTPGDSAINYGAAPSEPTVGSEPISGASEVAWSALVEEPSSEKVKIDSPSDADLLAREREELVGELPAESPRDAAAAKATEGEGIELTAEPPRPAKGPSDSAIDFSGGVAAIEEGSGADLQKKPEESAVFMAELASDASHVELVSDSGANLSEGEVVEVEPASEEAKAPTPEPGGEAVEVTEEAAVEAGEVSEEAAVEAAVVEDDSSAINLGAPPDKGSTPLSAEEVGEAVKVTSGSESEINLQDLPVPPPSKARVSTSSDSEVDLGSHAEIAAPSPGESGVEAVEAVAESGVDIKPVESTAAAGISDVALESLLSESGIDKPTAKEEGAVAEEAVSEEPAAAVEEPAVSEQEVNEVLAGLEETPAAATAGVTEQDAAEIAEGEQAIAEAEAEEAAEAAAEEETAAAEAEAEEKPAKPVKQRSPIPALVGGTFLGVLLGAGGLIGARVAGIDVPAMIGLGEKEKRSAQVGGPQQKAAPTLEEKAALVDNGDWKKADEAGIAQLPGTTAKELVLRGKYRLGSYLNQVGQVGKKPNLGDPALESALQDLQKAAAMKEPEAINALFDLALVKELAGKLPEAKAEYLKGLQAVGNDPVQKQRFQAAIDRVDVMMSEKPAGGGARLPQNVEDRALVLALMLIALQQPAQPPQPGQPGQQPPQPGQPGQQPVQGEKKEAGFDFWQASKLAREGKYSDAIRLLEQARKLHDERRFTRLRKAQNPLSDPAEDIFLRCCDELKAYWQVQDGLRGGGYLTDKNTPPQAVKDLLQKSKTDATTVKNVTDQLVKEKVIAAGGDVSKGVGQLIEGKKKAETAAEESTAKLKKATDDNTKLTADLKEAKKTIEKRDSDLTAAKEQNTKLKTSNDDLNATLKKISDDLAGAKLIDPKSKANVAEAVKKLVEVAKLKDPQGTIRQQRGQIAQLSETLKERRRPEEMLPLWLLLLDENRNRSDLVEQARTDVERVKKDPSATPAQKGEAAVVLGLALRNAEKFSEAKTVLEAARGAVDKGEWVSRAAAALAEVSHPSAYYARQAQALYDRGRIEPALETLAHAMKVVPAKEQGPLFAQRSQIELGAARARAKGALSPSDPLIAAARKDAAEAVNAKLAEGHYAAGRIAEELGQVDEAIKSYRAAVTAHGDKVDAEGARYRMALARVLLLPREARPGQPTPPRVGAASRTAPAGSGSARWTYSVRHLDDAKRFALMLTLGLQPPLLPGEEPGLEEAEKLADDVINADKAKPGSVPFNFLAQAWAVKGRWNVALQIHVEGIRPMLPPEYANGLAYLIRNDPRLKRPDTLRIPNPATAEKHFAAGLNFYFDRDYANAEREFVITVENDSRDARFFYFLGLSKLAQNRRREADADFSQGALLERQGRPSLAAVSESLERIQGPTRQKVNDFRRRPEVSQPRQR
jgi:tetratricopeptide (TPR) repeat protein